MRRPLPPEPEDGPLLVLLVILAIFIGGAIGSGLEAAGAFDSRPAICETRVADRVEVCRP